LESPQSYQPTINPKSNSALPVEVDDASEQEQDYQHESSKTWTLKEKVTYGFIGVAGLGGLVWLINRFVRKKKSNKEELKSFEEGSPATLAKQIKMAFDNDGWWGTNTELLRQTLIAVPSKQEWDKVLSSYEKLYSTPTAKASLLRDMYEELQSSEYNEMMQIIGVKPEKTGQGSTGNPYKAWAKRLKAAFDKSYGFLPGTDSQSVTLSLKEIPTQQAFVNTGVEYKKLYGTNLMDDLKAESEFGQYDEWIKIIVNKKKK
jgi:hypothetical protein